MSTYGKKKKRSILPSFSALRDSSSTSKTKNDKSTKRGSAIYSMSAFQNSTEPALSRHDDSIEEMASMLLDDTTIDQFHAEPGKRLSQIAAAKVLPDISNEKKALPQLPQLLFNGDDAWAMKTTPVVTAAGNSNAMQFINDPDEVDSYPPTLPRYAANHSRKGSAPPIPRRSSKRKSARPSSLNPNYSSQSTSQQDELNKSKKLGQTDAKSSKQNNLLQPQTAGGVEAANLNNKIEAMIAATKALKPSLDGTVLQGPFVPAKKRRLKDNKVFVKMKTAINDRLLARTGRKHDPVRDDRLLENSIDEMQEFEEDVLASVSALTTLEIRLNEGDNFKNPKIFSLTGHGKEPRKPVADDGKSLRSRKSLDDPFSETPQSRTPTSFEHRLRDDASVDQNIEIIPDLPSQPHTPHDVPQVKKIKQPSPAYEADFEALFSSSPLAQSTPRIRLEPTFEEDGKRTLKNVPADSRSLFDPDNSSVGQQSDMDVDPQPHSAPSSQLLAGTIKRKNSQAKDSGLEFKIHHSKRMKKHPSPSKAELEGLERAMRKFPSLSRSESFSPHNDVSPIGIEVNPKSDALAPKDPNIRLEPRPPKDYGNGENLVVPRKKELIRTTGSMPDFPKRIKAQKSSLIPKPSELLNTKHRLDRRDSRRYSARYDLVDGSMMDVDELQLDLTANDLNMKRV